MGFSSWEETSSTSRDCSALSFFIKNFSAFPCHLNRFANSDTDCVQRCALNFNCPHKADKKITSSDLFPVVVQISPFRSNLIKQLSRKALRTKIEQGWIPLNCVILKSFTKFIDLEFKSLIIDFPCNDAIDDFLLLNPCFPRFSSLHCVPRLWQLILPSN